jgi:hypothetical protein
MVDKSHPIGLGGLSKIKVHQDHEKGSKCDPHDQNFPIPEVFDHGLFKKRV